MKGGSHAPWPDSCNDPALASGPLLICLGAHLRLGFDRKRSWSSFARRHCRGATASYTSPTVVACAGQLTTGGAI